MLAGEIVDATVMRVARLHAFLAEQIARAKADDVLFSVHLKATMMKVSDPLIFGHVVRRSSPTSSPSTASSSPPRASARATVSAGSSPASTSSRTVPRSRRPSRRASPPARALAMVDSDKGITNLHVPSDVIVDASMPAMIRTSGHMWGPDGKEDDTLAVIPDSSYAGVYQAVLDDCRAHGAFDPTTMGSVPNVGLMAQAAEEYGSHDKTFEIARRTVRVVDRGATCSSSTTSSGDIWRACQTKDVPIRDWVKLAVTRARATGPPRSSGSTRAGPTTPT